MPHDRSLSQLNIRYLLTVRLLMRKLLWSRTNLPPHRPHDLTSVRASKGRSASLCPGPAARTRAE